MWLFKLIKSQQIKLIKKLLFGSIIIALSIALLLVYFRQEQQESGFYHLTTLAYTTIGKEVVTKEFIEEALELDVNNLINLHLFSIEEATKKLLNYPFIEEVYMEKVPPDTLFVEFCLRKPLVELLDFKDVSIDSNGVLFPTYYFYTPKKIPQVFLGLGSTPIDFKKRSLKIDSQELTLILKILKKVPQVKIIDLSRLHAESLAREEIVLLMDQQRIHLPVQDWEKAIDRLAFIKDKAQVIDFTNPGMALLR